MPVPRRSKAPWRWAIVAVSGLATAGFLGAVVSGPRPVHAGPPPTPVVVQQAPTLDQLLGQDQEGSGVASASPSLSQPRFRTRGS